MAVEVGDEAPDFTLNDQDRQPVTLSSLRGSKNVVVVFYPLAFTPVCKGELTSLRDDLATFENDTTTTLAISTDSSAVHRVWADEQDFGFRLLSDFWPHGEVARRYGVLDEEHGLALRGTFLVDREGVVRYRVMNAVPDARDQAELEKALTELA